MKTICKGYTSTIISTNFVSRFGRLLSACALLGTAGVATGQTLISGNVSGTWSPANNPYVVIDNATVPSGQTLTVEPGTEVIIGSNLDLTVNGLITAKGTPTDRIIFRGPNASTPYGYIQLNFASAETNEFTYCNFQTANTAVSMSVAGGLRVMDVKIVNCVFSNCFSRAIYGQAHGVNPSCNHQPATLNPVIENCVFLSSSNGCVFYTSGEYYGCGGGPGYGYVNPDIIANIFQNLSGTALSMNAGSYAGGGTPIFINNTIANSTNGVVTVDPYDALIEDNVFVQNGNAVTRSGSLSSEVGYNCFHQNGQNFVGYPPSYGQIVFNNRNGTPCDVAYNILQDPLFVSTNDFHLAATSPCIDAGTPDWDWTDMCFPPSQGTAYPDLGAYGGPDACNWLDVVPLIATTPWMTQSNGLVSINWGALPRSTYEIQYITNILDTNWTALSDVTAMEKPTAQTITATNKEEYYRIQSLGRTPGN